MGSIFISVAVVAIGVAVGLARGGRVATLRAVRPQWWLLLVGGFALQAFAENVDITGASSISVIGMFLLVVGLLANASIRGALIAALGVTLNLVVFVLNGAVPIRFEALGEAGLIEVDTQRSQITSVGHLLELETADSRLGSLGDTIPMGWFNSVISIGDLVTFAGVIVIVSSLIAARRMAGVDVDEVFTPAVIHLEEANNLTELELEPGTALAEMFGTPGPEFDDGTAVLDVVADSPVIDVSAPLPEAAPVGTRPIDLTFDPDDLWAGDDGGVRILGPSSETK